VSALDQPLDRVNYFNGQRLEAADFRADQDYQIRVRRKLLSSLYSVGVVQGLEVNLDPTSQHQVIVSPGLALDYWGREIILFDPTPVVVSGTPTPANGVTIGNFLTIAYAEQRVQPTSDGCGVATPVKGCGGTLSWGAPTRIRAEPKLEMADSWPSDQTGKIVLAQIALQAGCQVGTIESGVRKYAVPAKPPATQPISLEGEKDIDSKNSKILYFHIAGDVPDTVTLYLRGEQFSTLFYTELGNHTHPDTLSKPNITIPDHTHTFAGVTTGIGKQDATKPPTLVAWTVNDNTDIAFRMYGQSGLPRRQENLTQTNPGDGDIVQLSNFEQHTHDIPAGKTDPAGGGSYSLGTITPAPAGVDAPTARSGAGTKALGYVKTLTVKYDGRDITQPILQQLLGNNASDWPNGSTLGDGTAGHVFVKDGTGPISLTDLGLAFTPGPHQLEFSVGDGNGGKVQYNLYVS
jgi:hypothetical protein